MQLKLKNIGMIKEADITIGGLTVIAGENDTGKSTVGKLLFALIKAISRYKEDIEEGKEEKLRRNIEKIYFILRRKISFTEHIDLKDMFFPPKFFDDILEYGDKAIEKRSQRVLELEDDFLYKNIKEHLEWLLNELDGLSSVLQEEEDKKSIIKRAFKKVVFSEFGNELTNKMLDAKATIDVSEYENEILSIALESDDIKEFNLFDEVYYTDATFVETPIVLQMSELINHSKTYFNEKSISKISRPNVSLHTSDLNLKLKESIYGDKFLNELFFDDLPQRIESIMNGKIIYDKKIQDFLYLKQDGTKHKSLNVATGIKSFGILQLLLEGGFLNERTLMVLDEPEVHLHPKWQIKYAELIVELVKNDIDILVTSHSPYMIEALQRYSDKEMLESNFYIAEYGKILQVENSNEETISKIFEKLSEPFNIFEEMDSQSLQNG
jgi:predicted ATPase